MANFELRIYVIPAENIDEVIENNGIHDTSDLTDEQFVEVAEEIGTVYSLSRFLSLDVIAPDTDVIRAYFIDIENGNTPPIPADKYYTVVSASKISNHTLTENCEEQVLYLELNKPFGQSTTAEEPISRTYTIILTNHDNECEISGVIADIQDKDYVQDVELLEEYENKVRIRVEVDSDIDFDKLCTDLEDWLGVTADLINEVENY